MWWQLRNVLLQVAHQARVATAAAEEILSEYEKVLLYPTSSQLEALFNRYSQKYPGCATRRVLFVSPSHHPIQHKTIDLKDVKP